MRALISWGAVGFIVWLGVSVLAPISFKFRSGGWWFASIGGEMSDDCLDCAGDTICGIACNCTFNRCLCVGNAIGEKKRECEVGMETVTGRFNLDCAMSEANPRIVVTDAHRARGSVACDIRL